MFPCSLIFSLSPLFEFLHSFFLFQYNWKVGFCNALWSVYRWFCSPNWLKCPFSREIRWIYAFFRSSFYLKKIQFLWFSSPLSFFCIDMTIPRNYALLVLFLPIGSFFLPSCIPYTPSSLHPPKYANWLFTILSSSPSNPEFWAFKSMESWILILTWESILPHQYPSLWLCSSWSISQVSSEKVLLNPIFSGGFLHETPAIITNFLAFSQENKYGGAKSL